MLIKQALLSCIPIHPAYGLDEPSCPTRYNIYTYILWIIDANLVILNRSKLLLCCTIRPLTLHASQGIDPLQDL